MKRKAISYLKRCFCFMFVCLLIFGKVAFVPATTVFAEPQEGEEEGGDEGLWPEGIPKSHLAAESACLMDVNSGAVLYQKNAKKKQYPASITKVMTCLVALENTSLSENVTFSADAVYGIEPGSSHMAAEVGEVMTMEQCYYGMLLPSANEACLAVGEHIAGSKEKFCEMMNEKAKELGCVNSHFVNPNGLHDDDHYTCAYDMALIARAAYQYETFRSVCSTKVYHMDPTNKKEERWLANTHSMVNPAKYPQYEYEYCVGGKTGYTEDSLWTLVTFAKKDGMTLVSVVMRDYGPTYEANEYTDTKALFEYAFENYYVYDMSQLTDDNSLIQEDSTLFTRFSPLFDENRNEIYMAEGGSVILPKGADTSLIKQSVGYYDETKEIGGQHVIGKITYEYGGKIVGESDICYRKSDIPRLVTKEKKDTEVKEVIENAEAKKIKKKPFAMFLIIGGVALLVILSVVWIIMRKRSQAAEFSFYRNRNKKYIENRLSGGLNIEIKRGRRAKGDKGRRKRW